MTEQSPRKILGYDLDDPEQADALIEKFRQDAESGKDIKEIFNVPEEMLEGVYAVAYRHYQAGSFETSTELFRNLVVIDPHKYRFLLGLAASLHKLKDYEAAAGVYLLASMQRQDEPGPYFHGADCFARSNQAAFAHAFYTQAIIHCGDKPEFAEMKERAKLAQKPLAKKL